MINTQEKSDLEIKSDVLAELMFEPSIKVTDIGVLVKDGVVTLNGFVTSYGEKKEAVRAAKRVAGVIAIADDVKVQLSDAFIRTDGDIAGAAIHQIEWSTYIPKGAVTVTLRDGWIKLEGQVSWWYEKKAAEEAVMEIAGVKGVSNEITIKSKAKAKDIKSAVRSAFERNAVLDASEIDVEAKGNDVILRGKVRNYLERDEAERIAWAAPGVSSVDNQLDIEWFSGLDD